MAQLHFDYDARRNESVAYIGGDDASDATFRVRMIQDDSPANPFTDDDGHWPMIVDYQDRGHNFTTYDKGKGPSLDNPLARFTDGQIIRHQKAILAALGDTCYNAWTGSQWSLADDFAGHMADYCAKGDDRADIMRDYFNDQLGNVSEGDRLETLASLYAIIGIQSLCACSNGYSQGDYAELLIVATPEAMDAFGWPKEKRNDVARVAADMESQRKLYGQWAWGDCYGYIVEQAPADDDARDDDDAWQEVDSCWGFYGDDPQENGMDGYILSAIDYRQRQEESAARLIAALQEAAD